MNHAWKRIGKLYLEQTRALATDTKTGLLCTKITATGSVQLEKCACVTAAAPVLAGWF